MESFIVPMLNAFVEYHFNLFRTVHFPPVTNSGPLPNFPI